MKKRYKVDFDLMEIEGITFFKGSYPGWRRGTILTDGKVEKKILWIDKYDGFKVYGWHPRGGEKGYTVAINGVEL